MPPAVVCEVISNDGIYGINSDNKGDKRQDKQYVAEEVSLDNIVASNITLIQRNTTRNAHQLSPR